MLKCGSIGGGGDIPNDYVWESERKFHSLSAKSLTLSDFSLLTERELLFFSMHEKFGPKSTPDEDGPWQKIPLWVITHQ